MASNPENLWPPLRRKRIVKHQKQATVRAQPFYDAMEQQAANFIGVPRSSGEKTVKSLVMNSLCHVGDYQSLGDGMDAHRQDPTREDHPCVSKPRSGERWLDKLYRRQKRLKTVLHVFPQPENTYAR